MKYFIREALDKPPVGIYDDLYEAAKKCEPGYTVYDDNGNPMIGTIQIGKITSTITKTDYASAWNSLKEFYQNNLDSLKELRTTLETLPMGSQVAELFYEEIINKMEELEKENQIIWREY